METDSVEELISQRIIGEYTCDRIGPLVICMAGVHGNEPAGIIALKRVFNLLEEIAPAFKGSFIGIGGNLAALKEKKRFIEKDLNRCWTEEQVEYLKKSSLESLNVAEDIEHKQIIETFEKYLNKPTRDFLFVDLHTTSAKGGVFSICSDKEVTKSLAVNLQVPVVVGLEDVLHGTTLNFFRQKNLSAIGFEAGQHNDPDSVENMVAAIFILLEALGCIAEEDIPGFALFEIRLSKVAGNLPDILKFSYRYDVKDNTNFQILPGFKNFQFIEKGALIGFDNGHEVRSQVEGLILMPLYQKQGDDGFFMVKPMRADQL